MIRLYPKEGGVLSFSKMLVELHSFLDSANVNELTPFPLKICKFIMTTACLFKLFMVQNSP